MLFEVINDSDTIDTTKTKVLILILMEYALWAWGAARDSGTSPRLNPYSNGICSLRKKREVPRTY